MECSYHNQRSCYLQKSISQPHASETFSSSVTSSMDLDSADTYKHKGCHCFHLSHFPCWGRHLFIYNHGMFVLLLYISHQLNKFLFWYTLEGHTQLVCDNLLCYYLIIIKQLRNILIKLFFFVAQTSFSRSGATWWLIGSCWIKGSAHFTTLVVPAVSLCVFCPCFEIFTAKNRL